MSKFVIKKRLNLAFLGEGWEKSYIEFSPVDMSEMLEIAKLEAAIEADDNSVSNIEAANKMFEALKDILKRHFIGGEGHTGNDASGQPQQEPITAEDATGELFSPIVIPLMQLLRGEDNTNL